MSTPFSPSAVGLLEEINVDTYKISSMDCTNHYLLNYIAQTKKPVFISTGMATLEEIDSTLNFMNNKNSGNVTLLHCISKYPAEITDLNLNIIPLLKKKFKIAVGYSDHLPGINGCLAAFMVGAEVIETHFTLDNTRKDGDHHHSLNPAELKELVCQIKDYKKMLGSVDVMLNRPDREFAKIFRRGVYASKKINPGEVLNENMLYMARPVSTLSPNDMFKLANRCQEILFYKKKRMMIFLIHLKFLIKDVLFFGMDM